MTVQTQEAVTTPGALFAPRRIGHVNFWSTDSEHSAEFYGRVAGIGVAYRRAAIKAVFMTNGNTYHDVAFMDLSSPRGAGNSVGMHHFSLEAPSERHVVDGFMAAREAGFEFDFTISADVTNSAYGTDPDGNRFELYADIVSDWRSRRSGEVNTGAIPWIPGEKPPIEDQLFPVDPEIRIDADAIFQPVRCSHVVLRTCNHDAMLDHYQRIAGLKILAGGPGAPVIVLGGSLGEETLALVRGQDDAAPGMHHFGLEMANDAALDAARVRLAAAGMQPVAELDVGSRRAVYIADPDGLLIQFHVTRTFDPEGWAALPPGLAAWAV